VHGVSIRVLHALKLLGVAMAGDEVFDPYKDGAIPFIHWMRKTMPLRHVGVRALLIQQIAAKRRHYWTGDLAAGP